jgi:2-polyprenyl-3-methyl-5-hydroxy-6-metoxy-1,4-benzoquinol methylase
MTLRKICPICTASTITTFLKREQVPVHQHLVFPDQQAALQVSRADLVLGACNNCGFVFNQAFDSEKLNYGAQYDNTQFSSPYFQDYVNGLVRYLVMEKQVRHAHIVEVGCGKGEFLRSLTTFDDADNAGIGFDPSYIGPAQAFDGRLRFERRFYDETCTDIPADVVISRHVIEHIPDPVNLLRVIRAAVANYPHTRLYFETPCVEWILRNEVVWDFFYEHCSYFTTRSLTTAFEQAGLTVTDVHHVFDGQYLWLEATNDSPAQVTKDAGEIPALVRHFVDAHTQRLENWRQKVRELAACHTLALWGAGAKGVTFANLVDPERRFFACVVDLNPAKQGNYLMGTGHPIISADDLPQYRVDCAVLLNPNYFDEVRVMLTSKELSVDLVNIGG